VAVGVVMGAVLIAGFGGIVLTGAPGPDVGPIVLTGFDGSSEEAVGGVTEEVDLHTGGVAVESNAVPSGQFIVGGTSNISRFMLAHRTYPMTNKSAAGQLTYLYT
jgi:hypothetical protein